MSTEAGTTLSTRTEAANRLMARLLRNCRVSPADVSDLEMQFGENPCGEREAGALFELEGAARRKCPEWTPFFIETITDYVVWQCRPTGSITEASAAWLIAQVDAARTLGALAVLVNVLCEAACVPDWLAAATRTRVAEGWPGFDEAIEAAAAEERQAA